MIVGLLICAIGVIPIVLAFSVNRVYQDSNLSLGLIIFMILVSIWQGSIGVLYFKDVLNEKNVLLLFRLLRIGSTFSIPVVYYIAYELIKNYSIPFKNDKFLTKVLHFIFTKNMLIALIIWSSIIYMLGWTKYGIEGLKTEQISFSSMEFYFPEYGVFSWLYTVHIGSLIFFLLFLFVLAKKIYNTNIRNFLKGFAFYSLFLFLMGFLNFSPQTGVVAGSLGVIVFSIMIILEFMKLNTRMKLKYYQLMERQKKLDSTGHLAGSLIHEVKNTSQIIQGFSQLLKKSTSMKENEAGYVDMILKATKQIDNLANNYRKYMNNSKMEFKMEDLHKIIEQSIEFTKEMIKEKHVEIEFTNQYRPLKAFVNKTYLQQVFTNLIKNSLEAIPMEREIRKISIHTDLFEDSIVINFYDTGSGIPRENWESIFDPFITFTDKGMGLGLPLVKKTLFEHRGDIFVINSTPAGTCFQIRLPQFESSDSY